MQKKDHHSPLEANLLEVANYLYSHNVLIIIVATLCSTIVTVWTGFFTRPVYTSNASIIVKMRAENPLVPDVSAAWNRQLEIENKLYILTVVSKSTKFKIALGDEVKATVNLNPLVLNSVQSIRKTIVNWEALTPEELGNNILGSLDFSTDPTKYLIIINSQSTDAEYAQATANIAAHTLVQMNYDIILKEMNSVLKFVEDQTETTRLKLFGLEDELAQIQKTEKILSVPDTSSKIDNLQMDFNQAFRKLLIERQTYKIWIAELDKSVTEFKNSLQSGLDSHLYLMQVQKRIDFLLYQKSVGQTDRNVATEDNAELDSSINKTLLEFENTFKKLKQSSAANPWDYLKTLESGLLTAKHSLKENDAKIAAFKSAKSTEFKRYETLPDTLKKITQMRRNIDVTTNLFLQLKTKLQETQIQKSGKSNDLDILKPADLNSVPIGLTGWKKIFLSFIGSAFSIMLLLTLRYVLIPTIRNRSDLKHGGAEVIAEIPFAKISTKNKVSKINHQIVLKNDLNSDEANAIRRARFNLQEKLGLQEAREKKITKILTVCSASSREGKTFISANLAHAFSVAQFRVLLIDLDILNTSLRSYFNLAEANAPAQDPAMLENQFYFELRPVNEFLDLVDIPNIDKSVTDILETPLLGDYLNTMRGVYDIIIIDTPPIRNSLESLIASRFSDGLIFVANQRASLRYDVYKALETLHENYHKRIFAILNFAYDELNASRRRRKKAS